MSERKSEGLEKVYSARSDEELAAAYSTWSTDYDRENLSSGYCLPFLITAWVSRHVPVPAGPLLDAGCGTGLSGPALRALGYRELEGLDFSQEMLDLAARREAYDVLKRATLGETLPWSDRHFAAFFSTGVFTQGHAPASGLFELCRITRPGGHAIFTVRDKVFESGGFAEVFATLAAKGIWSPVEESPLFRAYAIDEPDVRLKATYSGSAEQGCGAAISLPILVKTVIASPMGSKFGCLANQFIVLQDHKRLPARFFARVSGALNSRLG